MPSATSCSSAVGLAGETPSSARRASRVCTRAERGERWSSPANGDVRPNPACEAVEHERGRRLPSACRGGKPGSPHPAEGSGIGRDEDDGVERSPGLRPTGSDRGVGARELDQRRRPARVVVRAGRSCSVVSMGNDSDGVVERPRDDRDEVAELHLAEPGDVLPPDVGLYAQPVQLQLLLEPSSRRGCVERPGNATGMVAGELPGEVERRRAVERRRQWWRGQRPRPREREDEDHERTGEQQGYVPDEPGVDRPVDRAPPWSPPGTDGAGRLHAGGYSRRGQASACSDATAITMSDSSATILLVDDEDSIQKLLTYPLERDGYRVVQARDGDEALRALRREPSRPRRPRRDAPEASTASRSASAFGRRAPCRS